MSHSFEKSVLAISIIAALACPGGPSAPLTDITGTWGGDNAGLIASDTSAHVHIGCTLGDTKGPIVPDAEGRFEATGTYNVDAYPVDRGIWHPATFSGRIVGRSMTLTVVLTDTGRELGPVTLTYGKEPKMGPCPICRTPHSHAGVGASSISSRNWWPPVGLPFLSSTRVSTSRSLVRVIPT